MRIADTNVLLGLVLSDRPEHSVFAEAAADAAAGPVLITEAVLAETVWTLTKRYGRTRGSVAALMLDVLDGPGVVAWDAGLARRALRLMKAEPSLSIVDCLLLERGLSEQAEIASFDRRMLKRAGEYTEL